MCDFLLPGGITPRYVVTTSAFLAVVVLLILRPILAAQVARGKGFAEFVKDQTLRDLLEFLVFIDRSYNRPGLPAAFVAAGNSILAIFFGLGTVLAFARCFAPS